MPAPAPRFRPRLPCAVALGLGATAGGAVGCAPRDPMMVIPRSERSWLQAEARLAAGRGGPREEGVAGGGSAISVAELLDRARGGGGREAPPATLTLRFAPGVAQPDAAQRRAVLDYAATQGPDARVTVAAARAAGASAPMLAERRAVAVARLLEGRFPEVEIRFASNAAGADEVVVTKAAPR